MDTSFRIPQKQSKGIALHLPLGNLWQGPKTNQPQDMSKPPIPRASGAEQEDTAFFAISKKIALRTGQSPCPQETPSIERQTSPRPVKTSQRP